MPDLFKFVSEFGSSAYQPNKNIDRLSIQLRLNGFSFCISNPLEANIFYFAEYKLIERSTKKNDWQDLANVFEDWIIKNKSFTEQFKETKIIIDTKSYSIIPSSFISNHKAESHLSFNQKIGYNFDAVNSKVLSSQQELVFPVHSGLLSIIRENFAEAVIVHALSELHNSIVNSGSDAYANGFVISYVSDRNLHLLVFVDGNLKFQNCYQYTAKEDFIYFILLIYNSHKLKPELNKLYLLGDINPSSALYNICYQYIRNIELLNQIKNLKLDNEFDSLPIHQYYIQLYSAL